MAQLRTQVPPDGVVSGKNATGSTIVKGSLVKLTATENEIAKCSAATDAILGVAMADILDGAYGDVQRSGRALVLTAAAVTIGVRLTSDANGKAVASSAGNAIVGVAATAGGTDVLAECVLGVGASH